MRASAGARFFDQPVAEDAYPGKVGKRFRIDQIVGEVGPDRLWERADQVPLGQGVRNQCATPMATPCPAMAA